MNWSEVRNFLKRTFVLLHGKKINKIQVIKMCMILGNIDKDRVASSTISPFKVCVGYKIRSKI